MTPCGRTLKWAGGEHDFDLGADRAIKILAGQVHAVPYALLARRNYFGQSPLQGQFGDTPSACLKRFQEAVYSIDDVECVLELALYGGGLSAAESVKLIDDHVRGKPLAENAQLAFAVLAQLFIGADHGRS